MSSSIYTALIDEKIRSLVNAYGETSHDIFYDEATQRLRHAGEFGMYRESIVREFLRFFVPGRIGIYTGFIITSKDNVSTQCDIVAYDVKNTPLIETGDKQRFFPVECVCAIGEVKSTISKLDLKNALNKLARVKSMREEIVYQSSIIHRNKQGPFDPLNYVFDQVPTFLICQRFNFDCNNIVDEVGTFYEADIPHRHRHNMILSLDDGVLLYADSGSGEKSLPVPVVAAGVSPAGQPVGQKYLKNRFVKPIEGVQSHIRLFCSYIFMLVSSTTILYPEMSEYINHSSDMSIKETEK